MARLSKRFPWTAYLIGLALAALYLVIESWATDRLNPILAFVLKWALAILTLPLWAGGLLLTGYFGALATLAYRDTYRNSGTKSNKLSPDERYEIDRVRTMWFGESQQACEVGISAVQSAQRVLERRGHRLAGLLESVTGRLTDAGRALESSFQRGERRPEIDKRFAEVYAAYGRCVCWYNRCLLIDKSLLTDDQAWFKERELQRWAELHKSFALAIETLLKHDGFMSFCQAMKDDLYSIRFEGDLSAYK